MEKIEDKIVETNEPVSVPYVVFRDVQADNRWAVKKLVWALIISIFLLFASNAIWLYVWNQYDYTSDETITTVDSEGSGIANYTGGNGGVNIGEGDSATD